MLYIALMWNPFDPDYRYWVYQNPDETHEMFFDRIKTNYRDKYWCVNFYKAEKIDE